jgi:glycosyltransferase involved in cell wall biosynthesis/acetyltransferase-like isoleucine patch superfamily enzyme
MREAGHEADILATAPQAGEDYPRALRDGWPVEALCDGTPWLWRRLEITSARLSQYDVVINNHSLETQLVLPSLPAHGLRLSVIRSTDDPVIAGAMLNSAVQDALVGISPQVTELLRRAGCGCPVTTIPNAVLLTNEALPVLSEPYRIAFVGRLEERQKNVLILPEIARMLRDRGVRFDMRIVGDGPHRKDLERKIRQFDVADAVRILGPLEREQAWKVFRESHFAILPSRFEGFGLVVAEAMAAGCVPIVSDIPVFRWILGDSAPLLASPVRNAKAYAEQLMALAKDPSRYAILQQRLWRRQRENFSPEVTVGRYLDLIGRLQQEHDPSKVKPVPLGLVKMPREHRLRCTQLWRVLQAGRRRWQSPGIAAKSILRKLLQSGAVEEPIPLRNAERYRRKGVEIGEGTYIYPNVVLGRDGQDRIIIGKRCVLTGCTILAHDASTNRPLGVKWSIQMPVVIEDDCFIGYGAIVLMGVRIGRGSIVGAGSVVTSDVPAGSVVAGNPARIIASVEELVQKRRQLALDHPECFRDLPADLASAGCEDSRGHSPDIAGAYISP